jgi:hypothetical protein
MTAQTPRALVLQLAKNISDDGMIIAHVKREFGVTYSKKDIPRIRSSRPVKVGRGVPVALAYADRVIKVGPCDPLLKALAGYHLKHSRLTTQDRNAFAAMVRQSDDY